MIHGKDSRVNGAGKMVLAGSLFWRLGGASMVG